jgi:hypothetical protein
MLSLESVVKDYLTTDLIYKYILKIKQQKASFGPLSRRGVGGMHILVYKHKLFFKIYI